MLKACTTVLVGKNATIDGSTIMARNDDTFLPYNPQRLFIQPAETLTDTHYVSNLNGLTTTLPENGYRYQIVPNVEIEKEGFFGESGFNEKNIGMSATESVYANERVLAHDPLIPNGIAEDSIMLLVLPYIHSARHGVEYLGNLVHDLGSAEGNGVIFSDKEEVWYMEIVTGHHWVAQRIPDDSYAVIANQVAQQQIDFNDPINYMWSEGIQDFVENYHLNPDFKGWNFRRIFGTDTQKDRHYNTPRVWFGQKYLTPSVEQDPMSSELPFLRKPTKKISLEDVEYILSSHYNETVYDPYGYGTEKEKKLFRPISLNRTQNSHVMQVRNHVADDLAPIMWLSVGVPSYTPYLPFYGNINQVHPSFSHTHLHWQITDAYWMYRTVTALVEGHYSELIQSDIDYLKDCREELHRFIQETDEQARTLTNDQLTDYLTEQNQVIVDKMEKKTLHFIGELVQHSIDLSKLTFNIDVNL